MKKFKFTLDKMLRYQNQILNEEKNQLAYLQSIRNQIERHIAELEQSFLDISGEMLEKQSEGVRVPELQTYTNKLQNIRYQLDELRIELQKAQEEVDIQMDRVIEASKEVSKLEKLYERQLEEYNKMVQKEEELFIDEFVSSESIRKGTS